MEMTSGGEQPLRSSFWDRSASCCQWVPVPCPHQPQGGCSNLVMSSRSLAVSPSPSPSSVHWLLSFKAVASVAGAITTPGGRKEWEQRASPVENGAAWPPSCSSQHPTKGNMSASWGWPVAASKKRSWGLSCWFSGLRSCSPSAGGPGSIPGWGTRSHRAQLRVLMPQLKILHTATKIEDPPCHNWDQVQSKK